MCIAIATKTHNQHTPWALSVLVVLSFLVRPYFPDSGCEGRKEGGGRGEEGEREEQHSHMTH